MDADPWEQLTAPFSARDLEWRVVRLSGDKLSAQVRPQLRTARVLARLDDVLGRAGWSNAFAAVGEGAISCTLSALGVSKSAVAVRGPQGDLSANLATVAEDALVYAAERFGLCPSADLSALPWVDYDPEQGSTLYEPEVKAAGVEAPPSALPQEAPAAPLAETPSPTKPAGQQAIDRLLERLKAEGFGLQAAKLVVHYGGYGSDPQAARELYAKLRDLLLQRPSPEA